MPDDFTRLRERLWVDLPNSLFLNPFPPRLAKTVPLIILLCLMPDISLWVGNRVNSFLPTCKSSVYSFILANTNKLIHQTWADQNGLRKNRLNRCTTVVARPTALPAYVTMHHLPNCTASLQCNIHAV